MAKTKSQKMFDFILRWKQSGLSKKAWCKKHRFAYSSFQYWYRRFRSQQSEIEQAADGSFIQLSVQDGSIPLPWCELVLVGGQRVYFHRPVEVSIIRSLLD